jgi:dihydroorotate dehydrogenase electron transfer subunit
MMKAIDREVMNNESDRFYILEKDKSVKLANSDKVGASSITEVDIELFLPYLHVTKYRITKYRNPCAFEKTLAEAVNLAPDNLSPFLKRLKKEKENINKRISDKSINKKNYHSLCFALLRIILSKDKYKIAYIDPAEFEGNAFGLMLQEMNCIRPVEVPEGIAFVAHNDSRNLLFCFDDQESSRLKEIASIIKDSDKGEFNNICVMIVHDMASMKDRRRFSKANKWPRGFFLCFEEIQRKAEKLDAKAYSQLCARAQFPEPLKHTPIMSVIADVKENIPVGEKKSHYKLRFTTYRIFNIIPGQFIMMATSPQKQDTIREFIKWDTMNPSWIEPKAYLKRPFGIHRAFYRYFSEDKYYLQKLSLPPQLSTVLHTVFPNKFEIFYKVLPNGIGTKELSKLQKGHKIQILGPLGKGQIIREIRDEGFDEIHVIGGGVGMAPLIFIVQALRYYSYKVKAFIGIEKIGMLKYKRKYKRNPDGLDITFSEEDPTIYIDDLIETGMDRADIYVSSEGEIVYRKIPKKNLYKGFVSGQYDNYLLHSKSARKILAFACGPFDMMKALVPITEKCGIPLKVLMEKRMACGIGVCLSCVCETKKSGEAESKYSRVCIDGPIFDASDIIWERIH